MHEKKQVVTQLATLHIVSYFKFRQNPLSCSTTHLIMVLVVVRERFLFGFNAPLDFVFTALNGEVCQVIQYQCTSPLTSTKKYTNYGTNMLKW